MDLQLLKIVNHISHAIKSTKDVDSLLKSMQLNKVLEEKIRKVNSTDQQSMCRSVFETWINSKLTLCSNEQIFHEILWLLIQSKLKIDNLPGLKRKAAQEKVDFLDMYNSHRESSVAQKRKRVLPTFTDQIISVDHASTLINKLYTEIQRGKHFTAQQLHVSSIYHSWRKHLKKRKHFVWSETISFSYFDGSTFDLNKKNLQCLAIDTIWSNIVRNMLPVLQNKFLTMGEMLLFYRRIVLNSLDLPTWLKKILQCGVFIGVRSQGTRKDESIVDDIQEKSFCFMKDDRPHCCNNRHFTVSDQMDLSRTIQKCHKDFSRQNWLLGRLMCKRAQCIDFLKKYKYKIPRFCPDYKYTCL